MIRAIGSLVVTVPAVAYLIQPQLRPKASHGHGHGDEGHGHEHGAEEKHEEKDEGGDETESSEGQAAQEESHDQGAGGEKSEEGNADQGENNEDNEEGGEGGSGGKHAPATPGDKGPDSEAHETEGGGNVEGVQFKGATSGGTKEGEQGDTRKHIPDAKGGSKKRIESHYATRQGEATEPEQDPENEDLVRLNAQYILCQLLTLSRVPHLRLQEKQVRAPLSPASRKGFRTQTRSIRLISRAILRRATRAKGCRRPLN